MQRAYLCLKYRVIKNQPKPKLVGVLITSSPASHMLSTDKEYYKDMFYAEAETFEEAYRMIKTRLPEHIKKLLV